MDRRRIDVGLASALLIAALAVLTMDGFVVGGVEAELGSMFVPRMVAGFIALFALMIGIPSLTSLLQQRPPAAEEWIGTDGLGGAGLYVLIFFGYWWALPLVGFLVATPVVIFAIGLLLQGRNWIALAAVSVITPLIIFHVCQDLLRVYLPTWSL